MTEKGRWKGGWHELCSATSLQEIDPSKKKNPLFRLTKMAGKKKPEATPATPAVNGDQTVNGEQVVEKTAKQLEKDAKKAAKMEKFKDKLQKKPEPVAKDAKPKDTKGKSAKPDSATKDVVLGNRGLTLLP